MDDLLKLEVGMNTGCHDELVFNVVKQGVVNIVSMSFLAIGFLGLLANYYNKRGPIK